MVRADKGKLLDFAPNLKKSAEFYAPWGDVRTVKFDAWWKDHQHLFGETLVQEVSAVTPHPDVMHLAVPLNQTVSKSLEQFLFSNSSAISSSVFRKPDHIISDPTIFKMAERYLRFFTPQN